MERQDQGQEARGSATSTPRACTSSRICKPASQGKTGLGALSRRHGGARRLCRPAARRSSTSSASPTTPSSSSRPTTAPKCCRGPTAAATPFRGEKDTNWEGGWRVPCVMRWPGVHRARARHQRHLLAAGFHPDLCGRGGETDLVEKVKKGYKIGDKTFKVHLDGFNLVPFLSGKVKKVAAQGLPLLERRRRSDGDALRQFEDRVLRAAQRRASMSGASRCRMHAHSEVLRSALPIRSSAARRASTTTIGSSKNVPLQYAAQAHRSRSGSRASRSFRRARSPRASAIDQIVEKLMPKD